VGTVQLIALGDRPVLVGGERQGQLAGSVEVCVDPVSREAGFQPGDVVGAEPLEGGQFVGPEGDALGQAVRERRGDEAAVATGRPCPQATSFQNDDGGAGVVLQGLQGGPEAGEATADDDQVGPM